MKEKTEAKSMEPVSLFYEKRAQILLKNLRARHFDACYCPNRTSALAAALRLIPQGSLVGWGGARSADQIGLQQALRDGPWRVIDRESMQTDAEREQAAHDCLSADFFLTGANAVSLTGELVNIDGKGNRVAAIVFGPREIIVIAGMNKVMGDLDSAIARARQVAAPANAQRFDIKTPCAVTGQCADCHSPARVCCTTTIHQFQRIKGRIKVLLVGEPLGF